MSRFSLMIFFVVVGLLLVGLVVVPGTRKIFTLIEKQRALEDANAELQEIMTSRDRLQDEYSAIPEADIVKLNALLPEKPEIGNLLGVYEAVAKRSGLALVSIDFGGGAQARPGGAQARAEAAQAGRPASAPIQNQKIVKTSASDIAALPVTQSLQGSYGSFRAYLDALEFLLNLTDITDISFNPTDLQNTNFSIRGTTYYFSK